MRTTLLLTAIVVAAAGTAWPQEPEPAPELAREASGLPPAERNDWRYLIIHHSATAGGNAARFDRYHRRKGWDCLAYHFVITNGRGGPDGGLQVGRRWRQQKHGAHAGRLPDGCLPEERNAFNEFGIGICLVGNLDRRPPTPAQLRTLARLIDELRRDYNIAGDAILRHRDVRQTACPGRHFPWRRLFARLDLPLHRPTWRGTALATTEHCRWCLQREAASFREETSLFDPKTWREGPGQPAAPRPMVTPPD